MNIKALWGFVGNAELLGADSPKVKSGQEFQNVDEEYAHVLLGKGLAVELDANGKPNTKPAVPDENKAMAEKAAADKAAEEKAAAEKVAAEKAAAEKAAAEKAAEEKAAAEKAAAEKAAKEAK
ncbi:hypothetical protein [Pseudomonas monsensis]|uniref:hypothetical protein n=1 Tax=Pseudomonas monsensis TaxID=2745509 RepID=UPI003D21790D